MFYGTETGDRLIQKNYPDSIKKYLFEEQQILQKTINNSDIIIEVGCMEGNNLNMILNTEKSYIGVDIVQRYINLGTRKAKKQQLDSNRYEFICLDAEKLSCITYKSKLFSQSKNPCFFSHLTASAI